MSMRSKLNVHETGRAGDTCAPTYVLAHGYGCDQTMWHPVAELLSDTRCILFDWAGVGRSDPESYDPVRHQTLDGYADDLIALLDELALQDPVIVGHSVAASIAALAAVRMPNLFGQLAMLAPSPCLLNDPPRYHGGFELEQLHALVRGLADGQAAWARAVAPVVMRNADRPALARGLEEKFCLMDPTIAVRWARATFLMDVRAAIPKITVPTMVMQCRNDALAPPDVGEWLFKQLPVGKLLQLQACGHCPHVSDPEEVAAMLRHHGAWRGQV